MVDTPPSSRSYRRPRQAELLVDISQEMEGTVSLNEALFTFLEIMTDETGAERGTLFLYDEKNDELFSRVVMGNLTKEIRIPKNTGVVGHVFETGQSVIVDDAYADDRFNRDVDDQTGYVTKSILCVPIRSLEGQVIGAAQVLNKKEGTFTARDQKHLEMMTVKAAKILVDSYYDERVEPSFLRYLKTFKHAVFGR